MEDLFFNDFPAPDFSIAVGLEDVDAGRKGSTVYRPQLAVNSYRNFFSEEVEEVNVINYLGSFYANEACGGVGGEENFR